MRTVRALFTYVFLMALLVCVALADAHLAHSAAPPEATSAKYPKSTLKYMKLPPHTRFIDSLPPLGPDDEMDMALRFRNGERMMPSGIAIMDGPGIEPFVADIRDYLNEYSLYYAQETGRPVPRLNSIPVYIVNDSNVNCAVVREDQGETGTPQNATIMGFLDRDHDEPLPSTNDMPATNTSPTPEAPSRLELWCTEGAIEELGKSGQAAEVNSNQVNQMAFVIGHELAHILLRHIQAQEVREKKQRTLYRTFKVAATISTLGNSNGNSYSSQANTKPTSANGRRLAQSLTALYLIDELDSTVRNPKFKIQQEREADLLAVDMLPNLPDGMVSDATEALTNLAAKVAAIKTLEKPPNQRLMEELNNAAATEVLKGETDKSIISTLTSSLTLQIYLRWRQNIIEHVHDDDDVRVETINDYLDSVADRPVITGHGSANAADSEPYPDPIKLRGRLWDGAMFKKAAERQLVANDLIATISGGGCQTLSADQAAFIVSEPTVNDRSQVEDYAYGVYMACQNKLVDSLPYLAAAAHGRQFRDTYELSLIQVQLLLGQDTEALAETYAAFAKSNQPEPYVPLSIIALIRLERNDEALTQAKACKSSQSVLLGTACMAAAGKTYDGADLPKDINPGAAGTDDDDSGSAFGYLKRLIAPQATTTTPATTTPAAGSTPAT